MSALSDEAPLDDHAVAADTAETAAPEQTGPSLYAIPEPPPPPEDDGAEGWLGQLVEQFHPPRFWEDDTPSPEVELNRARHGQHLQQSGPVRSAAVAYAHVAGLVTVRDKAKIWVRAHPTRLAVVAVVVGLLLVSPARPIVAWLLFGWQHLAFEALTG